MQRALSLWLFLGLACGDTAGPNDAAPPSDASYVCDSGSSCPPAHCRGLSFFAGEPEGDDLMVNLTEGGDASFTAGLQGQLMLTPRLSAVRALIDEGCVSIEIAHAPDPAFPGEPAFSPYTQTIVDQFSFDGVDLATPFLNNPLQADVEGRHIIVSITARGLAWAQSIERRVRVTDQDGFQPCDRYAAQPAAGGSYVRVVEGTAEFGAVTFGPTCDAEANVPVVFSPEVLHEGCDLPSEFSVPATRECYETFTATGGQSYIYLTAENPMGEMVFDPPLECACL